MFYLHYTFLHFQKGLLFCILSYTLQLMPSYTMKETSWTRTYTPDSRATRKTVSFRLYILETRRNTLHTEKKYRENTNINILAFSFFFSSPFSCYEFIAKWKSQYIRTILLLVSGLLGSETRCWEVGEAFFSISKNFARHSRIISANPFLIPWMVEEFSLWE